MGGLSGWPRSVERNECFGPAARMFANIRATGPEHSFLSTDLGQPDNPPIEDGLPLMVDRLLAAGFSEEEIYTMAVVNTVWLATGGKK